MKKTELDLLILLANDGAIGRPVKITTMEAALQLGHTTQQTVSRWVMQMQTEGLVQKSHGNRIEITGKGKGLLLGMRRQLESALSERDGRGNSEISGKLETGFGEGRYYVGLAQYASQIKAALGFTPFPGTMNVRIQRQSDIDKSARLRTSEGIPIKGFEREGRVMGAAKCFRCTVNGYSPCAIIIPDRTHYGPNVVELLAPIGLRKSLRLRDGSEVAICLEE